MRNSSGIGPFTLAPVLLEKPWGGRTLEPMLGHPPSGRTIGEAWLCSDLASTAAGGAGGGAMISQVERGSGEGKSLHELVETNGPELLGEELYRSVTANGAEPRFPLLLKLLDAERNLSVQVHPSPAYATAHPHVHVKFEAWYSLQTRGDASFYVGLDGIDSPEALREFSLRDEIGQRLVKRAVRPGDAVTIPSGVVHALGAGNTVFEVQTPSDTTFRLYDWTRETGLGPRTLHVDEACAATDFGATAAWSWGAQRRGSVVCDTARFRMYTIARGMEGLAGLVAGRGPVVLIPVEGPAWVAWGNDGTYEAPACCATVLPASLLHRVGALSSGGEVLVLTP